MEGVTRREVLATAGAAVAASCVLAACQSQEKDKPPQITSGTVNIGPATDFPAGKVNGKFLVTYGIYIANDSGTPVAIRPKCTHMGCIVKWDLSANDYECPCHHSKFSLLGLPLSGPAKRPLALVACMPQADGTLSVDLSRLYAL